MTSSKRIFWGAGIGFLLQLLAFVLNVPEGQTALAFVLNAGAFTVIPVFGRIIAASIPPFLWGAYFYFLPTSTFRKRPLIFVAVLLFHLAPMIWLAVIDEFSVQVAARHQTAFLVAYFAVLAVAVFSLVLILFRKTMPPKNGAASNSHRAGKLDRC
jgi:hypothetical protein